MQDLMGTLFLFVAGYFAGRQRTKQHAPLLFDTKKVGLSSTNVQVVSHVTSESKHASITSSPSFRFGDGIARGKN